MEKILTIDGRQVPFKNTGAFMLRYRAQFGRDALRDIYRLKGLVGANGKLGNLDALDLEPFYNLVWTLAKTADPNITPPMEWLDTFESFPLMDILPELEDMLWQALESNIESKKK